MTTRRTTLVLAATALLGACSPGPSPVAQQQVCGRLSHDRCVKVIAAVEAGVPEAKTSRVAIADYASLGPAPSGSLGSPVTYLVAFAPWPSWAPSGPLPSYLSPPMWLVTSDDGKWSLAPRPDVTAVNVCFIELLGNAGLTDYAPTFPSGVCG